MLTLAFGSELLQVQNFCSFQKCHFWSFSENFKSDTFESDKNCVIFENFLIFMENTIGIIPNTFHDFQKKIKSDTIENDKKFCTCRSSEPYRGWGKAQGIQNPKIWLFFSSGKTSLKTDKNQYRTAVKLSKK